MPSEVIERAIPAIEWPQTQTHAPHRTATGIGMWFYVPPDE